MKLTSESVVLIGSVLCIVILSGGSQAINIYLIAGVNFLLQLILFSKINFRISSNLFSTFRFIALYFIYQIIIDPINYKHWFFRLHDFWVVIMLINYLFIKEKKLKEYLKILFTIIVGHSVINFIVANFLFSQFVPIPNLLMNDVENWGIHRFLIFFASNETYLGIHRNMSFFWEPGILQFYLNIALFGLLYCSPKPRFHYILITVLMIISTLSTTGLLIMTIQLSYFVYAGRHFSNVKWMKVVILVFFVILVPFVRQVTEEKVSGARIGSYEARRFDTLNSLFVIGDNALGIGFNPENYQRIAKDNPYHIQSLVVTDRYTTNGLLIPLISSGWIFGSALIILMCLQRVVNKHRGLVAIILILSLSSEPIFFSPVILVFILSSTLKPNAYVSIT